MTITELAWALVLEIADELAFPKERLLPHVAKSRPRQSAA